MSGRGTLSGAVFAGAILCACSGPPPSTPPPTGPSQAASFTHCADLEPVAGGEPCRVVAGGAERLLRGNVLRPDRVYIGGGVLIDVDGSITCAGCDCDDSAATIIECPGASISPGLINPHDHLAYINHRPAPPASEPYEHRHDWRVGAHGRVPIALGVRATLAQLQWGELRFLIGGTTATVGLAETPIPGLLRNLDGDSGLSGLPVRVVEATGLAYPRVYNSVFPLGDDDGTLRTADCDYGPGPADSLEDLLLFGFSYLAHVAEGTGEEARNEFRCLSSATYDTTPSGVPVPPDLTLPGTSRDLVRPRSAFVHGIGLAAEDFEQMARDGTGLVWSPRSNMSLYGATADVLAADAAGVTLALGTDWVITGSMNMQRELACADRLDRERYGGHFGARRLWSMTTAGAAALTRTDDLLGTLAAGKRADIAVYRARPGQDPHRAIVEAGPADTILVMREGRVLFGAASLLATLGASCEALDVCGEPRALCVADELGVPFATLAGQMGGQYPLFFCGEPEDEPRCGAR